MTKKGKRQQLPAPHSCWYRPYMLNLYVFKKLFLYLGICSCVCQDEIPVKLWKDLTIFSSVLVCKWVTGSFLCRNLKCSKLAGRFMTVFGTKK